jgi:hypothetical protein
MREFTDQLLLDIARRRALTLSEQQRLNEWLALHPEDRERWEAELLLTRVVRDLPDAPLPSNFTARVLAAVDRPVATPARGAGFGVGWVLARWVRRWQPIAALAVVVLALGVYARQAHRRAEVAWSVAALPATELANVEVWRNFDVINSLPSGPLPSVEELAEALQ